MRIWYRNLDHGTLLLWGILTTAGLVAIYSSTHGAAQEFLLDSVRQNFYRQLLWCGMCVVVIVIALFQPVRFYLSLAMPAYVVSLILLIAALLFGREVGGAQSWISIGPIGFQSSELAKVGTLLAVAHFFSARTQSPGRIPAALQAVGLIVVPAILIVLQNDVGTALVYLGLIPVMLLWGGMQLSNVLLILSPAVAGYLAIVYLPAAIVFAVVLMGGLFWATGDYRRVVLATVLTGGTIGTALFALSTVLEPHQVARVISFTNPEAEEFRSGVGFHLVQSKAAIGSGGLFGSGFMEGTQTQGRLIPEQSTDFIFSVIGEEWGFVGAVAILVFFSVFLIRLVRIASQVRHPFASMIAAGAAGMYLIHLVINVGMVMGLLPVIGIPLPFLSYGGSALLSNTAMLAIALSLHMRRDDFSIFRY